MGRQKAFDATGVRRSTCSGCAVTAGRRPHPGYGLGRASLYNEFGDKHALLFALDQYCTDRPEELQAVLPVRAVGAAGDLSYYPGGRSRRCGLTRTSGGVCWSTRLPNWLLLTPRWHLRAAAGFERVASEFRSALERGQRSGEIDSGIDARAMSHYLANALNGLRLLAKMTDREVADNIVEVTTVHSIRLDGTKLMHSTMASVALVTGAGLASVRQLRASWPKPGSGCLAPVVPRRPTRAGRTSFVALDVRSRCVGQRGGGSSPRAGGPNRSARQRGLFTGRAIEEVSVADAQAQFDTNSFGVLRMIHAVLPGMRAQGSGRIINITKAGTGGAEFCRRVRRERSLQSRV